MKILSAHFEYMKQEISKIDVSAVYYAIETAINQPDDFNKRFRWDCLYAAGLSTWICNTLYEYLDDAHIDTALKNIIKALGY